MLPEWAETKDRLAKSTELFQQELAWRFGDDSADALLFLGFSDKSVPLPPSLEFWRDFSAVFAEQLRLTPDIALLRCPATAYNDAEDSMTTHTKHYEQNVRRTQVQTSLHKMLSRKPNIALAFLFGSFAKGTANAISDIDVAVLFNTVPDAYQINALRDRLATRLKADVDIVVLNSASPIIKMQVLKYGAVICKRIEAAYNNFYVDTFNQYTDLKMIRKSAEENILKGRIYA